MNISLELIDVLVAADWNVGPFSGRVYGGGGRILSSASGLPPGMAQWGFEIRGASPLRVGGSRFLPLAGMDVRTVEVRDWVLGEREAGVELQLLL